MPSLRFELEFWINTNSSWDRLRDFEADLGDFFNKHGFAATQVESNVGSYILLTPNE